MKRIITLSLALLMLAALFVANGCTVYDVAVEERNVGNYTHDKKISLIIEQQFLKDDTIKFLDFDAYSYEGHVYLIGEYESRGQIDKAVSIARSVDGVKDITTYFLPKKDKDYCGATDNIEIEATLRKDLIADDDIWSTNIDIQMIQCNVVLLGIVGSQKEMAAAIAHAKAIATVRDVKSFITVR